VPLDRRVKAALDELHFRSARMLRQRWPDIFRQPTPRRTSRAVLIRAIAWQIPACTYGGLSSSIFSSPSTGV